jgi:hypothetical protein
MCLSVNPAVGRRRFTGKASNTGAGDRVRVVALSGGTLVAGAWGEDSDATGLNALLGTGGVRRLMRPASRGRKATTRFWIPGRCTDSIEGVLAGPGDGCAAGNGSNGAGGDRECRTVAYVDGDIQCRVADDCIGGVGGGSGIGHL